ncbi:MAG: hypothetical protein BWX90_00304 [bacterium ADurb.Bin132]|nr:MAG: hypothetical protein BWX90_00304 [bacterium ADurb.Bin132]
MEIFFLPASILMLSKSGVKSFAISLSTFTLTAIGINSDASRTFCTILSNVGPPPRSTLRWLWISGGPSIVA